MTTDAETITTPETKIDSPETGNTEETPNVTPDETKIEGEAPEGEEGKEESKPDPIAEAAAARTKAELAKLADSMGLEGEFATAEELQAAISKAEQTNHEDEVTETVQNRFEDTYIDIVRGLRQHKFTVMDDDGNESQVTLTNDQIKDAVGDQLATLLHGDEEAGTPGVLQIAMGESFQELGLALASILPDAAFEAIEKSSEFEGKDGKGLNVQQWLTLAAEHMAPNTKAWKARETEHKAALAEAKAAGWEEAKGAPAGQVSQKGSGHGLSPVTKAQYLGMTQDERLTFMKEHPEEWRALS